MNVTSRHHSKTDSLISLRKRRVLELLTAKKLTPTEASKQEYSKLATTLEDLDLTTDSLKEYLSNTTLDLVETIISNYLPYPEHALKGVFLLNQIIHPAYRPKSTLLILEDVFLKQDNLKLLIDILLYSKDSKLNYAVCDFLTELSHNVENFSEYFSYYSLSFRDIMVNMTTCQEQANFIWILNNYFTNCERQEVEKTINLIMEIYSMYLNFLELPQYLNHNLIEFFKSTMSNAIVVESLGEENVYSVLQLGCTSYLFYRDKSEETAASAVDLIERIYFKNNNHVDFIFDEICSSLLKDVNNFKEINGIVKILNYFSCDAYSEKLEQILNDNDFLLFLGKFIDSRKNRNYKEFSAEITRSIFMMLHNLASDSKDIADILINNEFIRFFADELKRNRNVDEVISVIETLLSLIERSQQRTRLKMQEIKFHLLVNRLLSEWENEEVLENVMKLAISYGKEWKEVLNLLENIGMKDRVKDLLLANREETKEQAKECLKMFYFDVSVKEF